MQSYAELFYTDNLSLLMMGLVGFISVCIASFSSRYLKGDRKEKSFYVKMLFVVASVFTMVAADHLLLLFLSWATCNMLLASLMLHKREWEAARISSLLALGNYMAGLLFIGAAFVLLFYATGQTSIQAILKTEIDSGVLLSSSIFIILGAFTQSALWPFHRWLLSSLNSPTPVSALMHAGIVNGGGFLLARFAPLYIDHGVILTGVFVLGTLNALLGTLWKLMQADVKRMLACSTMGQMGFMFVQCGLGLFPAAIAHLCWHGMFKAYLFLASGSAAQEKRLDLDYPPSLSHFFMALFCGALGAGAFTVASQENIFAGDTTLFLILIAMIAGTQFSLPIIKSKFKGKIFIAMIATGVVGAAYGLSIQLIEQFLAPMAIFKAQPLSLIHFVSLAVLLLSWMFVVFGRHPDRQKRHPQWLLKAYVSFLNASQPHPQTITTHRNQYKY